MRSDSKQIRRIQKLMGFLGRELSLEDFPKTVEEAHQRINTLELELIKKDMLEASHS